MEEPHELIHHGSGTALCQTAGRHLIALAALIIYGALGTVASAQESRLIVDYMMTQAEVSDSDRFEVDATGSIPPGMPPTVSIFESRLIDGGRVGMDVRPGHMSLSASTHLLDPETSSNSYLEARHYETLTISPVMPAFGSGRLVGRYFYTGSLQPNSTGASGQRLTAQFDVSVNGPTGRQLVTARDRDECDAPCPATKELDPPEVLEFTTGFGFNSPTEFQLLTTLSTSISGGFGYTGSPRVIGNYLVGWLCIVRLEDTGGTAFPNWQTAFTIDSASGFDYSDAACDLPDPDIVASLLPTGRSVPVGNPATAFGTIINSGPANALGCGITPGTSVPAEFTYQTTDPATNALTGTADEPVDIPAGGAQTFVFAFTPTEAIPPTDVALTFDCDNSDPAPVFQGVNTLLLSASVDPVPDIIALAATPEDPGIVNIPGTGGTGFFSVASVNVGVSASISVVADTGAADLPVVITLCETNPADGTCINPAMPGPEPVVTDIDANGTPTFAIFVTAAGDAVPFDPAGNRVFVSFEDGGSVVRGSTSVALRTLEP